MGQSGEGNQAIVGWCAPLGPPHAPRVETLGVGAPPLGLGAKPPLGRGPPSRWDLEGLVPPGAGGLYIVGGEGG